MGSGCNNSNNNGFFGTPIPDKGVMYTGPAIPALDICTGDYLSELTAIILQKLLDFMVGKGIQVPEVNLEECPFIQEFITCCSTDKSLEKLFTILFKAICSLKTDLTSLEDKIDEVLNITFNLRCLTVSNPTIGNVINEIIREFCLLKTRVEVLEATVIDLQRQIDELSVSIVTEITDLVNSIIDTRIGNYLLNHIFSCGGFGLSKTGTGSTATLQFNGMVPPLCPIPYVGALSNFDNTGAGLSEKGYCGWFICNGQNSTPDMRGYTFASATTGVTGLGLDSRVSPNPTNYLDKVGEQKVVLTLSQLPSGSGTGSGVHNHKLKIPTQFKYIADTPSGGSSLQILTPGGSLTHEFTTENATVTGGSTGGENQPHENRQPTYHGVWIMRFN